MSRLLRIDRPVAVRPVLDGGWSWTCAGFPSCPGCGREGSPAAAADAGRDHLRTGHRPAVAVGVAA